MADTRWANFDSALYVDLDQLAGVVSYADHMDVIFRNGFVYKLQGDGKVQWRARFAHFLKEHCEEMK